MKTDELKENVQFATKIAIAVAIGVAVHFHAWSVIAGAIAFFYLRRDP